MRFFNERVGYPQTINSIKATYGVNPANDPARAAKLGIYPLVEAPEGFSAVAYSDKGTFYEAVPHEFSDDERSSIYQIQAYGLKLKEAAEKLKDAKEQPRKRNGKKQS